MNILISGATGLIGSALIPVLTADSHRVTRLVRSVSRRMDGDILWNPQTGDMETARLNGFDAVVHLAGETIVGRWTAAKKTSIRRSRIDGTRLLCESLASQEVPPRVLVCASAVGYYGNRGEEILTEDSPPGSGFLPDVCSEWEAAAAPALQAGIRVVHLRIGLVLTSEGGALAKMLPAFRLGAGGVVGSGMQYMSWITLDDLVGVFRFTLTEERLSGPVNGVTPHPVTNRVFTKTLGRVIGRPTLLPLPGFVARLAFGEMADDLLLGGARVLPDRLIAAGYRFRHPELEDALRHILGGV